MLVPTGPPLISRVKGMRADVSKVAEGPARVRARLDIKSPTLLQDALAAEEVSQFEVVQVVRRAPSWTPELDRLLFEKVDLASFTKQNLVRVLFHVCGLEGRSEDTDMKLMFSLPICLAQVKDDLEAHDVATLFLAMYTMRMSLERSGFAVVLKVVLPLLLKMAPEMEANDLSKCIHILSQFKVTKGELMSASDLRALFLCLAPRMGEVHKSRLQMMVDTQLFGVSAFEIGPSYYAAWRDAAIPHLEELNADKLSRMMRSLDQGSVGLRYLGEPFFVAWANAMERQLGDLSTNWLTDLIKSLGNIGVDQSVIGDAFFETWATEMANRTDFDQRQVPGVAKGIRAMGLGETKAGRKALRVLGRAVVSAQKDAVGWLKDLGGTQDTQRKKKNKQELND